MKKLILAALVIYAILLAGCRTAGPVCPTCDPSSASGADEITSQKEYMNKTLQWQKDQQSMDKSINNSRIKNRKKTWWQMFLFR